MSTEIADILSAPLDTSRVEQRAGQGGQNFGYLATHDVINHLNEIFGYEGWSDKLVKIETIGGDGKLWHAEVEISVKIGEHRVVHSDGGFGIARGTPPSPESTETAYKGAISDALKRAARKFGNQFGNSLYDTSTNNTNNGHANGQPRQAPPPSQNYSQPSSQQQPHSAAPQPSSDVPACPQCGGEMWDNRINKKNPNGPDFTCKQKNGECLNQKGFKFGTWESEQDKVKQEADGLQQQLREAVAEPAVEAGPKPAFTKELGECLEDYAKAVEVMQLPTGSEHRESEMAAIEAYLKRPVVGGNIALLPARQIKNIASAINAGVLSWGG